MTPVISWLRTRRFGILFLLLVAFSAVFSFYHLGSNSLHDGDEAVYAAVSVQMIETHDWLSPRTEIGFFFEKPPLLFWMQSAIFRVFGASEWTIRFWSALAAIGCVALTCLLTKELFGWVSGLWAGLAMSTSVQFLYEHCARTGEMEPMFLFLFLASFYVLLKSEISPRLLVVSLALMGVMSLLKNLAGFIPLSIGAAYLALTGLWRNYRRGVVLASLIGFFALSFGWIVIMALVHREAFLNVYLKQHLLERVTSNEFRDAVPEGRSIAGGVLMTARTLLNGFFPWSLMLLPAMAWNAWSLGQRKGRQQLLPLLWFAIYLVVVLMIKNKLYWYFLPLYPPACILVGAFLGGIYEKTRFSWWTGIAGLLVGLGCACLTMDVLYNPFEGRALDLGVKWLIVRQPVIVWVAAGSSLTVVWALLCRKAPRLGIAALLLIIGVRAVTFGAEPLRYSENRTEIHSLALDIADHAKGPRNSLLLWGIPPSVFWPPNMTWRPPHAARWYFSRIPRTEVMFLGPDEETLVSTLRLGGDRLFLMDERHYESIRERVPHRLLTRRQVGGNAYVLIAPPSVDVAERVEALDLFRGQL